MLPPTHLIFLTLASVKCATSEPTCFDQTARFPFSDDSTKYWECLNGVQTLRYCPQKHHFDHVSQTCRVLDDFPVLDDVECSPDNVDFLPHPSDCTKYVWCYYGTPYVIDCQDGLWFSPSEKRCVQPVSSGCATTTVPPWTTPDGSVCEDVPEGEIVLKRCTCGCLYFWECQGKKATLKECEFKLYFVEERQLCAGLVDCRDETRTPFPWTTTFPTTIVSRPDYNDPRCYGYDDVYFPHPDCTKFTHCEIGWGRVWNCPSGLYFNADLLKCGPYSESSCANFTTLSVPTATTTATTGDPRCNPDGTLDLLPDPTDCTKYIECYEGNSYLLSCPSGLWFSADKKICVPQEEADCIASTTVASTPSNYDPKCKDKEGLLLAHPKSCHKFLECYTSGTFERTCPSGLHFDGENGRCVSPKISTCVTE
ncbi:uncharacterized protein LOC135133109 [Zophobas morio]|uniref:uncharacterized protein LOC135133109 n=1 Tax=Zophobas morio TaxID=2755281 RepID=UPI003082CEEF